MAAVVEPKAGRRIREPFGELVGVGRVGHRILHARDEQDRLVDVGQAGPQSVDTIGHGQHRSDRDLVKRIFGDVGVEDVGLTDRDHHSSPIQHRLEVLGHVGIRRRHDRIDHDNTATAWIGRRKPERERSTERLPDGNTNPQRDTGGVVGGVGGVVVVVGAREDPVEGEA